MNGTRWLGGVAMVALMLLGSCATLDADECRTVDWHDLGVRDGRNGEPVSRLDAHRKACAEHGIGVREEPYLRGRDLGLQDYCRPDNAFQVGLAGRSYRGVCPSALDRAFRRNHEAAFQVHQLRGQIASNDSEIDTKERRLRDRKLTDADRRRLREEIRDLDRMTQRQRDDLRQAERDLDRLMDATARGR